MTKIKNENPSSHRTQLILGAHGSLALNIGNTVLGLLMAMILARVLGWRIYKKKCGFFPGGCGGIKCTIKDFSMFNCVVLNILARSEASRYPQNTLCVPAVKFFSAP